MQKITKAIAFAMALTLIMAMLPAFAAVFHSDVRVKLSIGSGRSFTFTPVGEYTLKEAGSSVGTDELTVEAVGSRVSIKLGDKTYTGPSLTLLSKNYGKTTDYIRLKNAEYGTCTYLGNMTFDVYEGSIRAINTLPIEQYLYGVVPHEMSNSFPVEALKSQAVCARGYAVARCSRYAASRSYDLVDTSKDQVYRGYASKNTRAIAAVDATKGQVLVYDGDIIEAFYSASNGGQTERTGNVWENDLPYYTHADDVYDLLNKSSLEEKSFIPDAYDETTEKLMDSSVLTAIKKAAYAAAGQEVELLSTVKVLAKDPSAENDPEQRCYTNVELTLMVAPRNNPEQAGQVTFTLPFEELSFGSYENTLGQIGAKKRNLRMYGAERGEYHTAENQYSGWFLTQRRYGHGVGLSQRSAQERARAGQKYEDILAFYYKDTALYTVGTYDTAPRIKAEGCTFQSCGISGIKPGTTTEKLLGKLQSDGALSIIDKKGAKKEGTLCTGDSVRNTYDNGLAIFDLPIVIYGDVDGNGKIDKDDIAALQKHLIRSSILGGPYLIAADVNHDETVDIMDMIRLIQYVSDDAKITQED